ncbi:MAG: F420-0--gamma-glutamyl ligase [Bacilli bacterium]|nr:F420-0--gamma-glutamyl ligase [Bacilli bacterium]
MRNVGTVVRGIRTPIIKEGMDLASVVVTSLLEASKTENFEFRNRDIVGITEAVVAISDGNYANVEDVATDIKEKYPSGHVGVVFPILSRNRFSLILKGIARGSKKVTILLSYPADEVGNHLFDEELLEDYGINPYIDVLDETSYLEKFGSIVHPFTGINYVDFYRELVEKEGAEVDFVFSNHADAILDYTKDVLACDIHTRKTTKRLLEKKGANVYGLDDILKESIQGSGFNPNYGLLGSNKSTEERLKLFPKSGQELVEKIQKELREKTGKEIEVMVYGDGAFKDPVGKIWELADPVVSPAYTKGLEGTPNEIKLKYVSDNVYADLKGDELKASICKTIKEKEANLKGKMVTQGTTPRRYTDLIGSLCDLTSGSGDKGTPVVFIQGYFDSLADE